MENEWDPYAADWDDDPGARAYAEAAHGSLVTVVGSDALAGATVLDFGCGTGLLTERLVAAGATVHAVDTSPAMLEVLDANVERHGWSTVHTSTALPDAAVRFDLVVCSSVCSFLDDYRGTAADLAGHLVPGGWFVQWDWERDDEDGHGLARTEIHEALTGAGLVDVQVDTAFEVEMKGQTMAPLIGYGRRPAEA